MNTLRTLVHEPLVYMIIKFVVVHKVIVIIFPTITSLSFKVEIYKHVAYCILY